MNFVNYGVVSTLKDGIATVTGLQDVTSGELVRDEFFNYGLALNLEKVKVGVVMFTEKFLKAGAFIYRTYKLASVKVGLFTLGFVLDSLGSFLNHGVALYTGDLRFDAEILYDQNLKEFIDFLGYASQNVELKAPGILARQSVAEPVFTGIKVIDAIIPLGKGQRELIIGDRQTGKTAVAVDAIINQATYDVIYTGAVGQR